MHAECGVRRKLLRVQGELLDVPAGNPACGWMSGCALEIEGVWAVTEGVCSVGDCGPQRCVGSCQECAGYGSCGQLLRACRQLLSLEV